MTKDKSIQYKKAYTELNEIFNNLNIEQKNKIPEVFRLNISSNMDNDYKFVYDQTKGIFEQNLMVETEALLVEIYERYLAPEEEKEMWQKYDRFCLNKIEEAKKEKYDPNIFKINKSEENNDTQKLSENEELKNTESILPIESKKENLFSKVLRFIKNIFNIK